MALAENDLAILTARFGCARFGASRFGFIPCPEDVHGTGAVEPGEYIWKEVKPPTTAWQLITEDCVCGQAPVAGFSMTGVSVPPLAAEFSSVNVGGIGEVDFTDETAGGTPGYTYSWNFGDGSGLVILPNPTHIYDLTGPNPETFTVTLTVTDSLGVVDAVSHDVVVTWII